MIAVNQLAHGLFDQPAQLLGSSAPADRDHDAGGQSAAASSAVSPASTRLTRPRQVRSRQHAAAPNPAASSASGTQLDSPDGSVMAQCLPAGAYLLYWWPNQGFQADEVHRGPAPFATVIFRGAGNSIGVHVSCRGGTPVERLYQPSGDDGSGGHDE